MRPALLLFVAVAATRAAFPVEVDSLICDSEIVDDQPESPEVCEDTVPWLFESELVLDGTASYYADKFEGRRTASGERFRQRAFTAAHRTLAFGTVIDVESVATGRRIRLRINDRGPFRGGFEIDLSKRAAQFLGVDISSDRRVRIRIVASPDEADAVETGPVAEIESRKEF